MMICPVQKTQHSEPEFSLKADLDKRRVQLKIHGSITPLGVTKLLDEFISVAECVDYSDRSPLDVFLDITDSWVMPLTTLKTLGDAAEKTLRRCPTMDVHVITKSWTHPLLLQLRTYEPLKRATEKTVKGVYLSLDQAMQEVDNIRGYAVSDRGGKEHRLRSSGSHG